MIPKNELDRLSAAADRAASLPRNAPLEDALAELVAGLQQVEKMIYAALVAGELEDWMPELLRRWQAALERFPAGHENRED